MRNGPKKIQNKDLFVISLAISFSLSPGPFELRIGLRSRKFHKASFPIFFEIFQVRIFSSYCDGDVACESISSK